MNESGVDVLHGDARDVLATLDPGPVNCVITDPPYGVDFSSNFSKSRAVTGRIEGDQNIAIANKLFHQTMVKVIPLLADEADIYVFTSVPVLTRWMSAVEILSLVDSRIRLKNILVWDKLMPGLGDLQSNWANSFELILYAKKGSRPIRSRRSSVITVERMRTGTNVHPTEKPVELLEILIRQSTNPGDLVLDPFAGSGSTVVAAQRTGRRGIGIEIDEHYVDVARERLTRMELPL